MLILGSTSPRRKELLESSGVRFKVVSPIFDESVIDSADLTHEAYVKLLATGKAQSLKPTYPNDVILSADTIVVFGNEILGKPKNSEDANRMLKKLNGKKHQVLTAVAILYKDDLVSFVDTTEVYFNQMSDLDIEAYVETKEPMDKAGAYGIQGMGSKFVREYKGDFHTIMGLPLKKVLEVLKKYPINDKSE